MSTQKVGVAIIGSGNIGCDLMYKILRQSESLELLALVGIDPASEGLERARKRGIATTAEGIDGLVKLDVFKDIKIVFDATSAGAHHKHNEVLQSYGIKVVDLTPAAIGPYVVPVVNMQAHLDAPNINMVTCGGQATIPMVNAVSQCTEVYYAEIIASISSKSAGPGTRANIDEFTETTSKAIVQVGGAKNGKAIIILNPAEPPLVMRDTVYCCVSQDADEAAIAASIKNMVKEVQKYVPGYVLKQEPQFENIRLAKPGLIPGTDSQEVKKVSVFLEVTGAGFYLPEYAGNLDIMTSAGMKVAEQLAEKLVAGEV